MLKVIIQKFKHVRKLIANMLVYGTEGSMSTLIRKHL